MAKDDEIKDVGEDGKPEAAPQPFVMPEQDRRRLEMTAKIQERINAQRKEDETPYDDPKAEADKPAAEVDEPAEIEDRPEPKAPAEDTSPVKLKVDGHEFEMARDAVLKAGEGNLERGIKILQMETAAQRRLDNSKAIAAQAQAYAQQVLAAAQAMQQKAQEKPAASTPDDAAILEAIRFGDASQASQALQILEQRAVQRATRQAQPQLTAAQVQGIIEDRMDYAKSMEVLQRDFSDITSDPHLNVLAGSLFQQKRAAGDQRSRVDLLTEIASEIRKWRGEPVVTSAEKLERKKTIQAVKPATVRQPAAQEEKPKSTEQIIAEMREQRQRGRRSA